MNRIGKRIVALTAALDLSLAAGASAAPGDLCHLTIEELGNGHFRMVAGCSAGNPNTEVVAFKAYGEDFWFDDYLFGWPAPYTREVIGQVLNEDPEGVDEIYIKGVFVNKLNGARYEIKSNVVSIYFV